MSYVDETYERVVAQNPAQPSIRQLRKYLNHFVLLSKLMRKSTERTLFLRDLQHQSVRFFSEYHG